jgi:ATP-dependent phosphofructokinase / diphosphate-dependent phosphofructokinase
MTESSSIRRVGMLFSGGPAPAANAVISAAAMSFLNCGVEVIGFLDGYEDLETYTDETPLVEGEHFLRLTIDDVSGIRNRKDIILRTSRANPGKEVRSLADLSDPAKNGTLMAVYRALESLEIDGLVSIGGDDTLKTANYIYELQLVTNGLRPVRVIHLPKTIDNDYYGIDWTFGFTSAANFAAQEITNIGADAKSTKCWYVLEIMGRKAGWLTYASGIAGEATRMVSVEDFDGVFDVDAYAEEMVDLMLTRAADSREYGVLCIAEGLAEKLPDDQRPQDVDAHGNSLLGSVKIGAHLAKAMEKAYTARTGRPITVRSKQIGYETRCANPVAFDILLGSQLGVGAHRAMVTECLTGHMVSVKDQLQIVFVPFSDLIDPVTLRTRVRFIERDSDFYHLARALEYQETECAVENC